MAGETFEIFHLAAVYDLAVRRDLAMRINVGWHAQHAGVRRAVRGATSAASSTSAPAMSAASTTATSPSTIWSVGRRFNNYYEETKYLAEVDVQGQMSRGLPATIYRPASVVGDSKTGETQKYDGPYCIMQWMLRNPELAIVPSIGDGSRYKVNFAPRDFVVDAIAYLSGLRGVRGQGVPVWPTQAP